ncbi:MAG: glutamate mutase L [Bacillota bacterium]|nr:glutamate mutase L [Bacillota bacterium]
MGPYHITLDVGSTFTKACLWEEGEETLFLLGQASAPTTVEEGDVFPGVEAAIRRLEAQTGRSLWEAGAPLPGFHLAATSSAAGGLQMLVGGVVRTLTAESAQRAAMGAGAVVTEVLALDRHLSPAELVDAVRSARPDLILLAGGTDDAQQMPAVRLAEIIRAAHPLSRLDGSPVPIIFAGSRRAHAYIRDILEGRHPLFFAENIRPSLEEERMGTVRDLVHRLFLDHVMARAPGYPRLAALCGEDLEPTPRGAGRLLEMAGQADGLQLLAADVGGATTDIFSVLDGTFFRSVSAHLGISYSALTTVEAAGPEAVLAWHPKGAQEIASLYQRAVWPTTLPEAEGERIFEEALAKEALRLAFGQHQELVVGLKGIQQRRTFDHVFGQQATGQRLLEAGKLDILIGSGGILGRSEEPERALEILLDGLRIGGVYRVYGDARYLLPHAGLLARRMPAKALSFWRDEGLLPLGSAAVAWGTLSPGRHAFRYRIPELGVEGQVDGGGRVVIPARRDQVLTVELIPARGVDLGAGPGKPVVEKMRGGVVGIVLDGRGVPLLPQAIRAKVGRVRP